jgi:hypothetical protein
VGDERPATERELERGETMSADYRPRIIAYCCYW